VKNEVRQELKASIGKSLAKDLQPILGAVDAVKVQIYMGNNCVRFFFPKESFTKE